MDMYTKTLDFLYQNRYDEEFHEVEHLFDGFTYEKISGILRALKGEGQIALKGGKDFVIGHVSADEEMELPTAEENERKPFKAKITYKGIQDWERKHQKPSGENNYNFNAPIHNAQIGDNNTQTNYTEIDKQFYQAISDSNVTTDIKNLMTTDYEALKKETDPAKKENKALQFFKNWGPTLGEVTAKMVKAYLESH